MTSCHFLFNRNCFEFTSNFQLHQLQRSPDIPEVRKVSTNLVLFTIFLKSSNILIGEGDKYLTKMTLMFQIVI